MSLSALKLGQSILGRSGSSYVLQRVLYERLDSAHKLWIAKNGFIVKTVNAHQYRQAWQIQSELPDSQFIRHPFDEAEEECALIFAYYTDDFLNFVRKKIASRAQIKSVLYGVLKGIRGLHSRDWVHGDIKPSNILVSWRKGVTGAVEVLDVVVSDTEDAIKLAPDHYIDKVKIGNVYWRSPEANLENNVDHKTDIFSFGSVVIYALSSRVVFAYDKLHEGQTPEMAVVTNQLSYFGHTVTKDFVMRFDDAIANTIADIWEGFGKTGRRPFAKFDIGGINDDDRKFLARIMMLDPAARAEAEELLQDPWWTA